MKRYIFVLFLVLVVVILTTSCGSVVPDQQVEPTQQVSEEGEEPYPGPGQSDPSEGRPVPPISEPYPEPEDIQPAEPGTVVIPTDHEYAPAPGDDQLVRGNVFIDEGQIILLESYPVQVRLQLKGSLPTPCHKLRAIVSPPDPDNRIQVEVYSLSDPDLVCTQVLEPFDAIIPLGNYTEGTYAVWVNEVETGMIDLP
jgi:hypothetical protein